MVSIKSKKQSTTAAIMIRLFTSFDEMLDYIDHLGENDKEYIIANCADLGRMSLDRLMYKHYVYSIALHRGLVEACSSGEYKSDPYTANKHIYMIAITPIKVLNTKENDNN